MVPEARPARRTFGLHRIRGSLTRASVTIVDHQGNQVFSGSTSTTISPSARKGCGGGRNCVIEAALPGYNAAGVPVPRSVDGWYFADIRFGGVIGLSIVELPTGAGGRREESVTISTTETGSALTSSPLG